jgi:hypothetical protein
MSNSFEKPVQNSPERAFGGRPRSQSEAKEVPRGHEEEAKTVLMKLELIAESRAEGRTVTEEMLDKNWSVWKERVARAAEVFGEELKTLNFSYDPQVIAYITGTAGPLARAIFKKFRNVITDRDLRQMKMARGAGTEM